MEWKLIHPRATFEMLGFIPEMLNERDTHSAREQLNAGYGHGGGWKPFKGFTLNANDSLSYPGDPPTRPIAETTLRDERIVLYEHAWVAIIQKDRSFEVCRMD